MKNNINPMFFLVLISFLAIGYLYIKVDKLEKAASAAKSNVVAQANAPVAPQQAPPEPKRDLNAIPPVSDKDHVLGNKNADIVLVEYSDFECPYCKRFDESMQQVVKDYGNKVAWVYRHYPLGFHAKAQKSAEASECANELGGNDKFWKMSSLIFEKMPALELTQLPDLAAQLGMNKQKFQQCLDSGKYAQHIKEDMDGGSKAGITGTPGTVIIAKNGKRDFIGGALPAESVKQQIDALLQ